MCVHVQQNSIYETAPCNVLYLFMYLCIYFDATGQLLIIYFAFVKYLREREKREYNEALHQLCADFKKVYNLFRRKVLYNILVEFDISMKLLRLIKMCLTETYSIVRVGKNLSDLFPIRNGFKHGDARSIVSAFRFCFRVSN
jgi:hypothetical protein